MCMVSVPRAHQLLTRMLNLRIKEFNIFDNFLSTYNSEDKKSRYIVNCSTTENI